LGKVKTLANEPAGTANRGRLARSVGPGNLARSFRPGDNDGEMRCGVIVVMVLFSLVAAPFAMALDGCSDMGTGCGASCSAPCVSVSVTASAVVLASVGSPVPAALPRIRVTALTTLDAPPKSPLFA